MRNKQNKESFVLRHIFLPDHIDKTLHEIATSQNKKMNELIREILERYISDAKYTEKHKKIIENMKWADPRDVELKAIDGCGTFALTCSQKKPFILYVRYKDEKIITRIQVNTTGCKITRVFKG